MLLPDAVEDLDARDIRAARSRRAPPPARDPAPARRRVRARRGRARTRRSRSRRRGRAPSAPWSRPPQDPLDLLELARALEALGRLAGVLLEVGSRGSDPPAAGSRAGARSPPLWIIRLHHHIRASAAGEIAAERPGIARPLVYGSGPRRSTADRATSGARSPAAGPAANRSRTRFGTCSRWITAEADTVRSGGSSPRRARRVLDLVRGPVEAHPPQEEGRDGASGARPG